MQVYWQGIQISCAPILAYEHDEMSVAGDCVGIRTLRPGRQVYGNRARWYEVRRPEVMGFYAAGLILSEYETRDCCFLFFLPIT